MKSKFVGLIMVLFLPKLSDSFKSIIDRSGVMWQALSPIEVSFPQAKRVGNPF